MHRLVFSLMVANLGALSGVQAGLAVSSSMTAPTGPSIAISATQQDPSGNTRIRYVTDETRTLSHDNEILHKHYYQRDRDLGQTFTVGAQGFYLDAITLRTGPMADGVQAGALGAKVSLQLFQVSGTPVINNNGTTGSQTTRWRTFNPSNALTDDYITGLTFTSLGHATGGVLPATLGANTYLTFDLTGPHQIWLNPNTSYGFLLMFDEPGPNRGMALANAFFGSYGGGHGIRREGSVDTTTADVTAANSVQMIENLSDPEDVAAALAHAKFNANLADRLARAPGTIGVPDVDTYRDLVFFIHASPIPEPSTHGLLSLALGVAGWVMARRRKCGVRG